MARGIGGNTSGSSLLFGEWVNNAKARKELAPIVVDLYKKKVGASSIAARLSNDGCGVSRAVVVSILKDAGEW
jgi:hypothetical protein